MAERTTQPAARGTGSTWRIFGAAALVVLAAGLVYGGAAKFCHREAGDRVDPADKAEPVGPGGVPLFDKWGTPEAAVVLSGETFGFLQPCGCSRPQMGGFERRANFLNGLKAKGWPVAGVDLGDLYPAKGPVSEQMLMKYAIAMHALRDMGYVAVGIGKTEYTAGVHNVISQYALQKERPPYTLGGNLVGVGTVDGRKVPIPRETFFPAPPGGTRPTVGLAEVAEIGGVPVGIVGVTGPSLAREAVKLDGSIDFEGNKDVLAIAVEALRNHPKKPPLNILLYQGTVDEAKKVADDWPQFHVILCQTEDSEPPQFPIRHAGKNHPAGEQTLLIQVGHKGRYVGVLGMFKKPGGGVELKYQLVPLGEEYVTPNDPAAEKANKVLPLLEDYARQVKDRNLMAKVPRLPHFAQIQAANLNLSYVGSEKCAGCHAGEFKKWQDTPHSHALEALEKKATRPGLRNFDGECVVCHTVGFDYRTGYETAEKTPQLKHVGCESCHGPGSGHVSAPRNADLLKLMSPWKPDKADKLPDVPTMDKLAKLNPAERGQVVIPAAQQRVINGVSQACMRCHDAENDPHFDLFKYWPKVNHSGLAKGGQPPGK